MEIERSDYLLQQYISKKCTSSELEEFMLLLKDHNNSADIEAALDRMWEKASETELDQKISDQILQQVMMSPVKTQAVNFSVKRLKWIGWAALLCIAGITATILYNRPATGKNNKMASAIHHNKLPKAEQLLFAETGNEHRQVILPDGSTVVLNNHSRISYVQGFPGAVRKVELTGEAYFDIRHDVNKSFLVNAGKVTTIVLGTAFNIRAYPTEKNITVTVTRGKVSVAENNKTVNILLPDQQIVFSKLYKRYNLQKVTARNSIEWQQGDIFFDDVSMNEAAQRLSARFNIPITFDNTKVANCRFTATFLNGESLDQILKLICSFNNAEYLHIAGGITIKGNGCEP
jgi:transmembrane sensor